MNTSTEAINRLREALQTTTAAKGIIDNLIAPHDYQDVASLVTEAAMKLLEAADSLMNARDEDALQAVELAEDILDSVYDIIDDDIEE